MARDVKFYFKSCIKRRRRKSKKKKGANPHQGERDSKREIKMIIHIRKTMGLSNGLAAAYKVEKKRLKVRKEKKERDRYDGSGR